MQLLLTYFVKQSYSPKRGGNNQIPLTRETSKHCGGLYYTLSTKKTAS